MKNNLSSIQRGVYIHFVYRVHRPNCIIVTVRCNYMESFANLRVSVISAADFTVKVTLSAHPSSRSDIFSQLAAYA